LDYLRYGTDMKTEWMLFVQNRAGQIRTKKFKTATAAEAAAYIAKAADPDANVWMQSTQRIGLMWERGAWHVIVKQVEGRGPMYKRMDDFAAACREYDLLCLVAAFEFFR